MKELFMQNFGADELRERDPLKPPDQEDDILQRDIIGSVTRKLMEQFGIPEEKRDKVALSVVGVLIKKGISDKFRRVCCGNTKGLRADLFAQIEALTNGERLNLILRELGFGGLDDFFAQHFEALKQALLEAGIDTDVRKGADEILH